MAPSLMAITLSYSVDAKVKLLVNPDTKGRCAVKQRRVPAKARYYKHARKFVEVCSTAFKRNPALAGPYWSHNRAANFLK